MIVGDSFVYIHVPRTAGTTAEEYLKKHHGVTNQEENHTSVIDIREEDRNKFVFGFVRNPFTFEWSLWKYHSESWQIFFDFDEWLAYRFGDTNYDEMVRKYPHREDELKYCNVLFINNLAGYFCDVQGRCIADKIYRFEELKESWEDISKRIDLDMNFPIDIPPYSRRYLTDYTEYGRRIIEKNRHKDMEIFGYSFEDFSGNCPLDYVYDDIQANYAYVRGNCIN
tara:strand:- start:7794 stop:8468 length:675 start_codon:yes stop_codon:yes gene_type:complete